jgi:putative acetyltransferase
MSLASRLRVRHGDPLVGIRAEQPHDAAAVRRVHTSAFPTTAEADLVERLRTGGKIAVSLVAELDNDIIGHIAFSRVTFSPPLDLLAYGLGPLAVVPGHERHAVGRRLVQNGLAECHARDACMVVVLGDFKYYSRFGFESASRHGLRNEFGVEESFMVFMLEARAHPPPATLVRYAPEFDKLPRGAVL